MSKRGQRVRPCVRCGAMVRFIRGSYRKRDGKRARGWHWVNEDGSHHYCGQGEAATVDKQLVARIARSMARMDPPWRD